ncbi:MAG TPA: aspartate aminotransferase family protein [Spirochaetota bacterium]|nr:aspartate aminotransferase family protein [Spirochaetota bacterium]HPI90716.1 aspartate aminotransferase family protein [Spirochaetota bacterium]HPR49737.1 aspartate aminotransferase family protein [Spirochaetota bacterium]
MNKTAQKNNGDRDKLLRDAAGVFSKGYVAKMRAEGLDIIEAGGSGPRLFDSSGNEYIDCFTSAATFNLGRGRDDLADALWQAARITDQGNFIAISEEKALLAEKLAAFMPGKLECALFTVVRGEAMDAACKLARGYTGRPGIVTVDGGWYGHTGFSLSMSGTEDRNLFGPGIPEIQMVTFGDIESARKAVSSETAAVVLETIQAENGCRYAENEYYRQLRDLCDRSGAMLIVDESQTGFGRTGKRFSFEYFGFEPDIAVLGEAITGGMFPMSAISFTRTLKSFFDHHPLIHLCTFGGHDVGCMVAVKALELYEKERPWENAKRRGAVLKAVLHKIAAEHKYLIHDVWGEGLLLSIILKDEKKAQRFCVEAKNCGMICTRGRVDRKSVIVRPVLTLSNNDVQDMEECFRKILSAF